MRRVREAHRPALRAPATREGATARLVRAGRPCGWRRPSSRSGSGRDETRPARAPARTRAAAPSGIGGAAAHETNHRRSPAPHRRELGRAPSGGTASSRASASRMRDPLRPAAARRHLHAARVEPDLAAPREEQERLPRAARDRALEAREGRRVGRDRQRVVDREEEHAVPLGLALAHDPAAHPRRLLPVQVARIVARRELAQRADVGSAAARLRWCGRPPRASSGGTSGDGRRDSGSG